jgi:hypothetical protein
MRYYEIVNEAGIEKRLATGKLDSTIRRGTPPKDHTHPWVRRSMGGWSEMDPVERAEYHSLDPDQKMSATSGGSISDPDKPYDELSQKILKSPNSTWADVVKYWTTRSDKFTVDGEWQLENIKEWMTPKEFYTFLKLANAGEVADAKKYAASLYIKRVNQAQFTSKGDKMLIHWSNSNLFNVSSHTVLSARIISRGDNAGIDLKYSIGSVSFGYILEGQVLAAAADNLFTNQVEDPESNDPSARKMIALSDNRLQQKYPMIQYFLGVSINPTPGVDSEALVDNWKIKAVVCFAPLLQNPEDITILGQLKNKNIPVTFRAVHDQTPMKFVNLANSQEAYSQVVTIIGRKIETLEKAWIQHIGPTAQPATPAQRN